MISRAVWSGAIGSRFASRPASRSVDALRTWLIGVASSKRESDMDPGTDHTFRTKTGQCTITSDQILLSMERVRGAAAGGLFGHSMGRTFLVYGVLGAGMLIEGVRSFLRSEDIAGSFLCLVGVLLFLNIIVSRRNSATPIISRTSIREVSAHPPRPPLTRGYFTVVFIENGKERRRLIMLPGSLQGGRQEYDKAEGAMRSSGLLV